MIQFTPHEGVRAKPLEVPDPFDPPQGWTFYTVRSDSVKFQPFSRVLSKLRLFAEGSEHRKKLLELQESQADNGNEQALMLLDEETCNALEEQGRKLAEMRLKTPSEPSRVAELVTGWSGILDDEGNEIEFSRERLLSMLSDEGEMAVMNGNGPAVIASGSYGGFTLGQALCQYLPGAIEDLTLAERVEIESKKTPSESPPVSGGGSVTKAKSKRTKRIAEKTKSE